MLLIDWQTVVHAYLIQPESERDLGAFRSEVRMRGLGDDQGALMALVIKERGERLTALHAQQRLYLARDDKLRVTLLKGLRGQMTRNRRSRNLCTEAQELARTLPSTNDRDIISLWLRVMQPENNVRENTFRGQTELLRSHGYPSTLAFEINFIERHLWPQHRAEAQRYCRALIAQAQDRAETEQDRSQLLALERKVGSEPRTASNDSLGRHRRHHRR